MVDDETMEEILNDSEKLMEKPKASPRKSINGPRQIRQADKASDLNVRDHGKMAHFAKLTEEDWEAYRRKDPMEFDMRFIKCEHSKEPFYRQHIQD